MNITEDPDQPEPTLEEQIADLVANYTRRMWEHTGSKDLRESRHLVSYISALFDDLLLMIPKTATPRVKAAADTIKTNLNIMIRGMK